MIVKPKSKALCRSCDEPFERLDGQSTKFCGLNACYAEAIRTYWRKLGFEATVKYVDGNPVPMGMPDGVRRAVKRALKDFPVKPGMEIRRR